MSKLKGPFVLVICDGWGENADTFGNAIAAAHTPELDQLRQRWPHTTVAASGEAVGLPTGQQGNSEVGHLTIGTGRIVQQPLSRQLSEIKNGSFYHNPVLTSAIQIAKLNGSNLHIMGLMSPGGVHSHSDGAVALVKLASQMDLHDVFVHAFTDGRDTPPDSGIGFIKQLEAELTRIGTGRIASIAGRYYAMDRDHRWDRTQLAYEMLTNDDYATATSATDYISSRYDAGETDEFLQPVRIAASPEEQVHIKNDDVVIFFNFRPDRARQLSHALVDREFTGFPRQRVPQNLHFVSFAKYDNDLSVPVAFPKDDVNQSLAEVVSRQHLPQFHIAETEKYAHVTYFINGGREAAFPDEDRQLIPSPKVATYDQTPAMSAEAITDAITSRIKTHNYALIIVNFANADMVGHTGNLAMTTQAVEVVDRCLGRISDAALSKHGALLMTADHGNAEAKIDRKTNQPITSHTTNPVPVVLCGTDAAALATGGGLQDIAPTILAAMDLPIPREMTGHDLAAQ